MWERSAQGRGDGELAESPVVELEALGLTATHGRAHSLPQLDLTGSAFTEAGLTLVLQHLCSRVRPGRLFVNVCVAEVATRSVRIDVYAQLLRQLVASQRLVLSE